MNVYQSARLTAIVTIACAWLSLEVAGSCERPWIYPPDRTNQNVRDAISRGRYREALNKLLQVAAANSGTSLGGQALISAADTAAAWLQDPLQAKEIRERVVREYPGSRFELVARQGLVDAVPGSFKDFSRRLAGYDEVARHFGAPPVSLIRDVGPREDLVLQAQRLHPEIRYALGGFYKNIYRAARQNERTSYYSVGRR